MGERDDDGGRFPLGFCIASIASTSLGLAAAVGNVRWGMRTGGDGLQYAFIYVNVMLMMTWLVLWPASCRTKAPGTLARQLYALAIGALPAMAVSAFVAGAGSGAIFATSLLHLAMGVFAWGLLSASTRMPALSSLLPMMALALPIATFIVGDLFPKTWSSIDAFAPPVAVVHAAQITSPPNAILYIAATIYAAIGLASSAVANQFLKQQAHPN